MAADLRMKNSRGRERMHVGSGTTAGRQEIWGKRAVNVPVMGFQATR